MQLNNEATPVRIAPRQWVAIILWTLSVIAAAVLGGRALAGAFDATVSAIVPCVATATTLLMSLLAWHLHVTLTVSSTPMRRLLVGFLSLMPVAVIGFATSVPASPVALGITTGLLLIGIVMLVVSEAVQSGMDSSIGVVDVGISRTDEASGEDRAAMAGFEAGQQSAAPAEGLDVGNEDDLVEQRIVREHSEDGREWIEAELIATFNVGEKETAVHLPIHPALSGTPVVECEPLDASDVSAAVSVVHPYGVRVQVRRNGTLNEPMRVPIGIAVSFADNMANVA